MKVITKDCLKAHDQPHKQSSSCSTTPKSWIISPLAYNSTLGVGATVPGSRAEYSTQDKSFITNYQATVYNPTDQRQSKPSQWIHPLVSEYLWPMQVFIEVFSENFSSFCHRNISQCWSLQLTESLDWDGFHHIQESLELEMFPSRRVYTGNRFNTSSAVTSFAASTFGDVFVLRLGLFVWGGSAASQKEMSAWSEVLHLRQICHLYAHTEKSNAYALSRQVLSHYHR